MATRRPKALAEQIQLAITNCQKTGNIQDWKLTGGLRITVAFYPADERSDAPRVVIRLARQGSIPSVTDVEFIRAAVPQLHSAQRTPTTGYNRSQDESGRQWRWVSFSFTPETAASGETDDQQ